MPNIPSTLDTNTTRPVGDIVQAFKIASQEVLNTMLSKDDSKAFIIVLLRASNPLDMEQKFVGYASNEQIAFLLGSVLGQLINTSNKQETREARVEARNAILRSLGAGMRDVCGWGVGVATAVPEPPPDIPDSSWGHA